MLFIAKISVSSAFLGRISNIFVVCFIYIYLICDTLINYMYDILLLQLLLCHYYVTITGEEINYNSNTVSKIDSCMHIMI